MSFPFFGNTINFLEHSSVFVREPGFFTAKPLLAHNLPLLPARRRGHMPMGLWMKELPPGGPDGSGEKRFLILFSVFGCPALPYDADLDLSGIFKLFFDFLNYITCNKHHLVVAYNIRLNHYANLTTCLNCERLFNAFKRASNFLKLFKTLNVILNILSSCTGTCS